MNLEFGRFSDGEAVDAFVEFEIVEDSDFIPVGQSVIERKYWFPENIKVIYSVKGARYSPTQEEIEEWDKEILKEILRGHK